jgi:hypothetical protein
MNGCAPTVRIDVASPWEILCEARFFLEPVNPLHRQYEALRAYFVEGLPSAEAARRFGYTPGAFRVLLCQQFRRTEHLPERFFREIRHGPQAAPAHDPVRDLVVALRKKNLSVYDIQAELATQGHTISINSLSVLLHEEGFARLPQRRDEERPARSKPERAEVADVRQLDLAPRSFRTPAAGLFLFVHLMRHLDRATAKVLFENLLDISGRVDIEERRVVVTLDKRAHTILTWSIPGLPTSPHRCPGWTTKTW